MTQIPHAEQLGRAPTAAHFAAVIALLDTDLNEAIARKQELQQAEDRAIFGEGDLAAARAALDDCNAAIALVEKAIEDAEKRRVDAPLDEPPAEPRADTPAPGDEVRTKAEALGERWRMVHWLIEQLRQELFAADALNRAITTANGLFDTDGGADFKVNLTTIRRAAMAGARAAAPSRLSRPAIQADRLLLSFLSPGGVLDRRPAIGAPVEGIKSKFIPAGERG
ncbi:hypothetical protein NKI56_08430 [Mesorhizobium sp. M0622]|uniref:hypothetical protein n=1 Tax=unclassified Mesorhizobium TaxID=325217 RepID=UPI003336A26F